MNKWLPAIAPVADDLLDWLLDVWHKQAGGDAIVVAGDGEDSMVLPFSIAQETDIVRLTIRAISNAEDLIFQPTWVAVATGAEVDPASSGDADIFDAVSIAAHKGWQKTLAHYRHGLADNRSSEIRFEELMLAVDAASAFLHRVEEE